MHASTAPLKSGTIPAMLEIALVLATIVTVGLLGFLTTIITPRLMTLKPWFTIGGIGFVLSIVGGLAAIAGLLVR